MFEIQIINEVSSERTKEIFHILDVKHLSAMVERKWVFVRFLVRDLTYLSCDDVVLSETEHSE